MANNINRIKSINEYCVSRGLPKPMHPLISVINFEDIKYSATTDDTSWVLDLYSICLKRNFGSKIKYGQKQYDFDEGILFFMGPGQVFNVSVSNHETFRPTGYMLLIHPDFLWNTALAKTIKQYEYFNYATNEALFLSEAEEEKLIDIFKNIEHEYQANIDKFSLQVIAAQLELLLTYADRFYHRQFITRKITNHDILTQLEAVLSNYFNSDKSVSNGLPTVQFVASQLHLSPSYLSRLLQTLTGQSTKSYLTDKLLEQAKQKLSSTELSVSRIAYELGFEHSQSFSKLFKSKVGQSPVEFRAGFN
jgi:AraC family transcriptional regulator, transcriptional activator of pobA